METAKQRHEAQVLLLEQSKQNLSDDICSKVLTTVFSLVRIPLIFKRSWLFSRLSLTLSSQLGKLGG